MATTGSNPAPPAWRGVALRDAAGPLAVLALAASIPVLMVYDTWSQQKALKEAWDIVGPSCLVLERPLPTAFGTRPPREFDYGGARFARRYGHASCMGAREGGPLNETVYHVCQFSGPAVVAVTTARGTVTYKPGVGRRATVTLRGGKPSCVVGGWFAS